MQGAHPAGQRTGRVAGKTALGCACACQDQGARTASGPPPATARLLAPAVPSILHPPATQHTLQVADIEAAEKEKMKEKCEKIVGHGINCFVNRQVRNDPAGAWLAPVNNLLLHQPAMAGLARGQLVACAPGWTCSDLLLPAHPLPSAAHLQLPRAAVCRRRRDGDRARRL